MLLEAEPILDRTEPGVVIDLNYTGVIDLDLLPPANQIDSAYRRGVANYQQGDYTRALDDFSQIVSSGDISVEQLAQVFLYRASCKYFLGDHEGALSGFTEVLRIDEARPTQRALALGGRSEVDFRLGKNANQLADLSSLLSIPEARIEDRVVAFVNRGVIHYERKELDKALADFTSVITMDGVQPTMLAYAHHYRAGVFEQKKDFTEAIEDYGKALESNGLQPRHHARAFINRARTWRKLEDRDAFLNDLSEVIGPSGVEDAVKGNALVSRASLYIEGCHFSEAIADCLAVNSLPNARTHDKIYASVIVGACNEALLQHDNAISEYSAALEFQEASEIQQLLALTGRWRVFVTIGDHENSKRDFDRMQDIIPRLDQVDILTLITLAEISRVAGKIPDALTRYAELLGRSDCLRPQRMVALVAYGICLERAGRYREAIGPLNEALGMKECVQIWRLTALETRAGCHIGFRQYDDALADINMILSSSELPPESRSEIVCGRGKINNLLGNNGAALVDFDSALLLAETPDDTAYVHIARGEGYTRTGAFHEALRAYATALATPGLSSEFEVGALFERALAYGCINAQDEEMSDYTTIIKMGNVSGEERAKSLVNRGFCHVLGGEFQRARADYEAALALEDIPDGLRQVAEKLLGDQGSTAIKSWRPVRDMWHDEHMNETEGAEEEPPLEGGIGAQFNEVGVVDTPAISDANEVINRLAAGLAASESLAKSNPPHDLDAFSSKYNDQLDQAKLIVVGEEGQEVRLQTVAETNADLADLVAQVAAGHHVPAFDRLKRIIMSTQQNPPQDDAARVFANNINGVLDAWSARIRLKGQKLAKLYVAGVSLQFLVTGRTLGFKTQVLHIEKAAIRHRRTPATQKPA